MSHMRLAKKILSRSLVTTKAIKREVDYTRGDDSIEREEPPFTK